MKGRIEGRSELPPTYCTHTTLERGHSCPPVPGRDCATDRSTRTVCPRPGRASESKLLPLIVLGLIATVAAGASTAYAQLTAADIAALRERGRKEGWTFQVGESSATRRPLSQLCGAVEPPDWRENARFEPGPKHFGPLPATFDWRTQGASVPIRDQLNCGDRGSCWAFATVGPLEYGIQIKDGLGVDLSEQYLISCNTTANPHWDCDWGGWAAHDWHMNTAGSCGHTGAVLEAYYPYIHADPACTCTKSTNHVYRIRSWAYLGGRQDTNPPVDVLKQAILDHGPITVCVYAGPTNSPFHAYAGGIFNACSGSNTDHDHMVVLVGWDDNQGGGVWFARNSWGTDWGENGYMRITYNCCNIGYAACYIDYAGADALQVSPSYGLAAEGLMGGPFDPATVTYTLSNQSTGNVAWVATWTQPWLEMSPNHAGHAGAVLFHPVTVTVNSNANALGPGLHTDAVMFRHIFGAPDHTNIMPVSLTVQRQPILTSRWTRNPRWSRKANGSSANRPGRVVTPTASLTQPAVSPAPMFSASTSMGIMPPPTCLPRGITSRPSRSISGVTPGPRCNSSAGSTALPSTRSQCYP